MMLAIIVTSLALTLVMVGPFLLFALPKATLAKEEQKHVTYSVIIPARNEAKRLPLLLDAIKHAPKAIIEWIVVDDQSTDGTSEVARSFGAQVVTSKPLPKGWFGKPWACYQGAQFAKGDIFIFLDADTRLRKNGLAKIMATFLQGKTPLSIQPYHRVYKFYEQFSVFFNLIVMMTTGLFTPFKNKLKSQSFFGPCQVIHRDDYWVIDGHACAKSAILEDIVIGQNLLEKTGKPIRAISGKGSIEFRMYDEGLSHVIEGWSKNFATGATLIQPWMMIAVSMWLTGIFIQIFSGIAPFMWVGYTYLYGYTLVGIMVTYLARKVGSFSYTMVVLYPLYIFFFVYVFVRSSRLMKEKKVSWKGRELDL
jgi:4,4'-diaponeurosporenoate glycosyltransferase